jgi:hypothetical protein
VLPASFASLSREERATLSRLLNASPVPMSANTIV